MVQVCDCDDWKVLISIWFYRDLMLKCIWIHLHELFVRRNHFSTLAVPMQIYFKHYIVSRWDLHMVLGSGTSNLGMPFTDRTLVPCLVQETPAWFSFAKSVPSITFHLRCQHTINIWSISMTPIVILHLNVPTAPKSLPSAPITCIVLNCFI